MRRIPFLLFFTLAVSVSFWSTRSEAQPNSLKEIVKGVWFREGDLKGQGHCNNIIIEMKDYLIVIDANFPSGAQLALADARKVSSKPVKYVFDTHHHGDHAYGNPVWTKIGAITLAHKGVVDEMNAREPKAWLDAGKGRKDIADLNLPTAERPKQTFDKGPFVLEDSTRRVEFHHFGWAHTKGDGFAYLPKERIICTGDAATNGPYNYMGHANIGNWASVLQGALKLDIQRVLPGHGPAGGREIVEGEIAFVTEVNRFAEQALKSGKKLEDLVTMKDGRPAATTAKLPEKVKHWVGDSFPTQIYDAFMEKQRKAPRGDLNL
jgi:glyoxylase-like metal-dependent hydrolase (beta-lactamase superfamily II)